MLMLCINLFSVQSCNNHSTYGCDDSSSEEEGTTQIPVAGVIGGITNGIHTSIHSLHRVLGREAEREAHEKRYVLLLLLRFCPESNHRLNQSPSAAARGT